MIKINLLPVRAAAKLESVRKQLSIAVLSLVACVLAVGYFDYSIRGDIAGKNTEIAEAQKEINRLKSVIAKVKKFKKDSKVLEKKLNVIKVLNLGRQSAVFLMDELSNVTPEKLWLKSVKENKWKLNIKGQALSQSTIADFMTNMEKSALFSSVKWKFTQSKKEGKSGITFHDFTVEVLFLPPSSKGTK